MYVCKRCKLWKIDVVHGFCFECFMARTKIRISLCIAIFAAWLAIVWFTW